MEAEIIVQSLRCEITQSDDVNVDVGSEAHYHVSLDFTTSIVGF